MQPARLTLLAVFPFAPGTGFTRVMSAILERLPGGWDLHCLATRGTRGERWLDGVTLHSGRATAADPGTAADGRELVERVRPDVLLFLDDPPVVARAAADFAACRHRPRVVAYCPVDGFLTNPEPLRGMEHVDRLVSFTRFGQRQLAGCLEALRQAGARTPDVTTIPLGVDTRTFAPLGPIADPGRRRRACRELFPDRPELHDSFIVLNANTGHPRKRMETTLWGFAAFAEGKPERVRLYLHYLAPGCPGYADSMHLARRLGIAGRLIPSLLGEGRAAGFSDVRLNLLYNACAVGVNTADGEGWGLIGVEHAATGAAQIVPRHSALTEIWSGAATLLPPLYPTFATPGVERRRVSSSSLAVALEALYRSPRSLREQSLACYARATDRRRAWNTVAAQWQDLLIEEWRESEALAPVHPSPEVRIKERSKWNGSTAPRFPAVRTTGSSPS